MRSPTSFCIFTRHDHRARRTGATAVSASGIVRSASTPTLALTDAVAVFANIHFAPAPADRRLAIRFSRLVSASIEKNGLNRPFGIPSTDTATAKARALTTLARCSSSDSPYRNFTVASALKPSPACNTVAVIDVRVCDVAPNRVFALASAAACHPTCWAANGAAATPTSRAIAARIVIRSEMGGIPHISHRPHHVEKAHIAGGREGVPVAYARVAAGVAVS